MSRRDDHTTTMSPLGSETTRRETVQRLSGGLALAALAFGFGRSVLAEEATPAPGAGLEGKYGVIRVRKIKADRSNDELTALVRDGFVPLMREVPGFVSYVVLWNAETRDWAAVGFFADKTGADESNARAAVWGTESGAVDFTEGDPIVIEGAVVVAARTED